MRKIFTFLFAALMSVGMYATTEVTITQDDFPKSGKSFTKDGVTVSAGNIDGTLGNLKNGGSFSTTLGNFTQIEVTAADVHTLGGEGWSGNMQKMTWTGNASSVSFSGNIMGMGQGTTLKFTIEEPGSGDSGNPGSGDSGNPGSGDSGGPGTSDSGGHGTTAVENVQTNHVQATKFFRDGQLLIEKNGKTYNATGAEVK